MRLFCSVCPAPNHRDPVRRIINVRVARRFQEVSWLTSPLYFHRIAYIWPAESRRAIEAGRQAEYQVCGRGRGRGRADLGMVHDEYCDSGPLYVAAM